MGREDRYYGFCVDGRDGRKGDDSQGPREERMERMGEFVGCDSVMGGAREGMR